MQPADLSVQTEALEARLMLTIVHPPSATVIEDGVLGFAEAPTTELAY